MADLKIDIATVFSGKKAFKEADTATSRLTKQVGNLAKSYAGLYGVQRLANGLMASARAFAQDDLAAKVLSKTLNNLGLGFGANAQIVNDYISRLEKQTGVLDDELRPAMDRLLRATGDITKSQKLLNLTLDIAAGTGKTVAQVSQSLQKAYLGQTAALGRLGVGLSKAELTSSSFEEIQTRLAYLFEGQAAQAADTYIGKMNKLTVATNNAKEAIGKGLFDALASTGGGGAGGFEMFTKGIDIAAQSLAMLLRVMGKTSGAIGLFAQGKFGAATDLILGKQPAQRSGLTPAIASELKKAAAEKAAAKNRAAIAKATQSQTKAIKEQTALQKANGLFEMDQIQIVAALKGKLSAQDRTRAELQLAILQDNTTEASKLAGEVAKSQGLTEALVAYYSGLPDAKNPFSAWVTTLTAAAQLAADIAKSKLLDSSSGNGTGTGAGTSSTSQSTLDKINQIYYDSIASGASAGAAGSTARYSGMALAYGAGGTNVVVNVQGSVVSQQDLVSAVRDGLLNNSLSGKPANLERNAGQFAP